MHSSGSQPANGVDGTDVMSVNPGETNGIIVDPIKLDGNVFTQMATLEVVYKSTGRCLEERVNLDSL